MAKEKKQKEATLENVLWECRVALRGYGSFEKNRDAVIGLTFLKFASDKFEKRKAEIKEENPDMPFLTERPSSYNAKNVYYLDEECRWEYIKKHASDDDIAVKIDKAMKRIEEKNPALLGTLPQNAYVGLGAPKEKIKDLIDEINKINEKRFQEEDLIGRVY